MITRLSFLRSTSALLLVAALGATSAYAGAKQLWTAKLPGDAKWHSLTGLGTLLVGTPDGIVAYDPESGQQLWSRSEFKKSTTQSAREIPGTPFLLCNTAGGVLGMTAFTLFQIDYLSGKTVWQTPEMSGQYLGVVPVPAKGLVLMLVSGSTVDASGHGTYVHAFDFEGKLKWATRLAPSGAIQLHQADNTGKFLPRSDLSGYHDPVVEGDTIYLPYLGCQALDLSTGTVKWGTNFEAGDKVFKKTYAPLRIEGDRIFGAGGGSVVAMNKHTGVVEWKSDRISAYAGLFKARDNALVSQLEIVGGKVFARYGGNFSDGKKVALREPLGVVVLNATDGAELYHFDSAKEGITNLVILPEQNTMMFADAHHLYGLDIGAATPVETFKVPIEFKRKMGGGEVAQLGLGALGGVSGLVKAGFAQSKARLDVPVAIVRQGDRVVVQGKQHLLSFDPKGKAIAWSTYWAAPSDTLGMAMMFSVTAFSGIAGNASAAAGGFGSSAYQSGVESTHASLDHYNQYAGKRKSATQRSSNFSFLLTKVEDGKEKGIGVVGINLANGESEKTFILGAKEPDYRVDEAIGRLFFFKGKDSIIAYEL